MVKSYINLVKAVEPFEHCFTEPGLLGQSSKDSIFDNHGVADLLITAHIRSSLALVSPHALGSNQPTTQYAFSPFLGNGHKMTFVFCIAYSLQSDIQTHSLISESLALPTSYVFESVF